MTNLSAAGLPGGSNHLTTDQTIARLGPHPCNVPDFGGGADFQAIRIRRHADRHDRFWGVVPEAAGIAERVRTVHRPKTSGVFGTLHDHNPPVPPRPANEAIAASLPIP